MSDKNSGYYSKREPDFKKMRKKFDRLTGVERQYFRNRLNRWLTKDMIDRMRKRVLRFRF